MSPVAEMCESSTMSSCVPNSRNLVVHLLVCLFGIGSWIAVNGSFVQLPILVLTLPEGLDLAAYVTVSIQLGNIGPGIYILIQRYGSKNQLHVRHREKVAIYTIILTGILTCTLLAFFWRRTSYIGGVEHSTVFLTLLFFLALVDCTSSVLFLPFMSSLKSKYIPTLFIGEGLSGLLPALLGLAQGAGNLKCVNASQATTTFDNTTLYNTTSYSLQPVYQESSFSVNAFYVFLVAIMVICGMSFVLLNHLPLCKRERITVEANIKHAMDDCLPSRSIDSMHEKTRISKYYDTIPRESQAPIAQYDLSHCVRLSNVSLVYLLILIFWINAVGNGILPALQSYSCMPYGMDFYHLTVTLSLLSNPLASFIAFLLSTRSSIIITAITVAGTAFATYVTLLAAMSPSPVLVNQTVGAVLMLIAWILVTGFFSYAKVAIATVLQSRGKTALVWCGIVTQAGSLLGALLMIFLVIVAHVFKSSSIC